MIQQLLQAYTSLLEEIDKKCAKAHADVPEIPCKKGCFDCCKQLFPISMIEACYLNLGFQKLDRPQRRKLQRHAEKVREKCQKFALENFEISSDSLEDIAATRNKLTFRLRSAGIDCPILSSDGLCNLYENRNHDCRIHGLAYDPDTDEMIGCFRHPKIFAELKLHQKFMNNAVNANYLYKEKSKLDSLMTIELGKDQNLKYCYYFTTPYQVLLKNFATFNWPEFFQKKKVKANKKKYSLLIDG